jgi:ABC-type lipoprotein export system ATPase subunit
LNKKVSNQQVDDFIALFDTFEEAQSALRERIRHSDTPTSLEAAERPGRPIIEVQEVSKSYSMGKRQVHALKNVSFTIHEGKFTALTGVSGSGKSTLLQLIGGLDVPSEGKVIIDQTDIRLLSDAKLAEFRNKTIGFVFQFFYLQPFLKVAQNIEVPGMFLGSKRAERREHAHELVEKVGLTEQELHFPKELSGGQVQRAAIARALLNNPKILLADEPTGNLDAKNGQMIISLFKKIQKEFGTTIVIVTHDPDIAAQADQEIRLHDGEIE